MYHNPSPRWKLLHTTQGPWSLADLVPASTSADKTHLLRDDGIARSSSHALLGCLAQQINFKCSHHHQTCQDHGQSEHHQAGFSHCLQVHLQLNHACSTAEQVQGCWPRLQNVWGHYPHWFKAQWCLLQRDEGVRGSCQFCWRSLTWPTVARKPLECVSPMWCSVLWCKPPQESKSRNLWRQKLCFRHEYRLTILWHSLGNRKQSPFEGVLAQCNPSRNFRGCEFHHQVPQVSTKTLWDVWR